MKPEQRTMLRRIDRQFDAVREMRNAIPARERYRHGIEGLSVGAYIRVGGQLQQVVSMSHYEGKQDRWYELELFGLETGARTTIEWEKDDEVEISLNGPELSLADLGVTADEVEEMSDAEAGSISHAGRTYHYDDDYGATYHRDSAAAGSGASAATETATGVGAAARAGAAAGEKVYFYDFETSDERYCLTIEEWGDERQGYEYAAFVSEYLEPDAIEVVSLGSDGGGI